ncbi:MAG TPA: ABC transporter permease [Chloroflexi bacterium]|nr:ABC transporter permease [Chloroflexota bacterium]
MAQTLELPSQSAPVETSTRGRRGSPWTGLWAVVGKEMADHLSSVRMQILEVLILLTAVGAVYAVMQNVRQTVSQDPFIFLRLFTTARDPFPAFVGFLSFLVPLIAIAISFDAINGEFSRRTMSRVLAQPIYRDALLLGKFLAGLFTLSLVLTAIWLLIMGMGILGLGLPPNGEEVARSLIFLVATIFYGGIWLALGMVFSTIFRQPATAALAGLSVWLFFTIFWGMVTSLLARTLSPVTYGFPEEILRQLQTEQAISRLSPNTLYVEATLGILNPAVRSFGILLPSQLEGAVVGAPLPLAQSILLMWPQLTGLIAATILLFALAYVLFQRQEIRA